MNRSIIPAIALVVSALSASNILSDMGWDVGPTPLMVLEEAGIIPTAENVAKVLNDPSQPPKLRHWAAMALAQLEATEYLPDIIRALDDSVLIVQQGAIAALQFFQSDDAIAPLCLKSSSSMSWEIRFSATLTLFAQPGSASTQCIIRSATRIDEQYQMRWQALYHLSQNRVPDEA